MERLGTEASVAGVALVTLYTVGALAAEKETGLFETPVGRYPIVKPAVAVGAMGWRELAGGAGHASGIARTMPNAISEAQPMALTVGHNHP
jgi:hypothetical protein